MGSENTNTADHGVGYLGTHRFLIELDGVTVASFRTMSGLSSKQDVIEYKLGGDRSVRRKPGRVSFNNITLERGFSTDTALAEWRQNIIDGKKQNDKLKEDRRSGAIVYLNADGSEALRYNFFRAWPVSWEGPGLNATGNDLAIEKLELAVEWIQIETS